MALRATVYKAELSIADLDRSYYADHVLTLARHPSETEERMMMRLIAFALNADPALSFGAGLSTGDEPDLWRRDLTGAIEQWIEVGLPDERVLRKAAGRAAAVGVYAYGGRKADAWWSQNAAAMRRIAPLSVVAIDVPGPLALAGLAERTMRLSATIQDGQVLLSSGERSVTAVTTSLLARADPRR
ncbi:MAG: YaeQ family protein [Burkholderiaceae bacterium]